MAFIWTEGVGNQSFSSYLASADVDTGGFNFTAPTAISADGLNIVGAGYLPGNNNAQGFIVNLASAVPVPEPSSRRAVELRDAGGRPGRSCLGGPPLAPDQAEMT